ncbi:MAG: hypothetical protein RTU63_05485 [Candidatus Thorarchaeota archaeon]
MEADQLPGYKGPKRKSTGIICDCTMVTCVGSTVLIFLFLNAWDALEHPITPEQMSQTMLPFILSSIIVLVIWLAYRIYILKLKA